MIGKGVSHVIEKPKNITTYFVKYALSDTQIKRLFTRNSRRIRSKYYKAYLQDHGRYSILRLKHSKTL
jgi:hypothetical protein